MKLIATLGAAALVAGVGLMPLEASAAPQTMTTKTVTRDGDRTTTRTVTTRNRSARGGWHWRTKCKTWYHHGRKYKSCKRMRTRW